MSSDAPHRPRSSQRPAVDFDLMAAATRVVEGALTVVPGEILVIVTDPPRARLAAALADAAQAAGATPEVFNLDDFGNYPLSEVPEPIARALEGAQATVFVCRSGREEVELRRSVVEVARRAGARHAHMVGVTPEVMVSGMAADPKRIANTARALRVRLGPGSRIRVTSRAGSELELSCDPRFRWVENSGVVRAGRWLNLPAGELLTTPASVTGRYVCDESITELPGNAGERVPAPLTLNIEDGRVRSVQCDNPDLAREVEGFLRAGERHDRVGLMSFGTNVGLSSGTGRLLVDQTMPGLHLGLGMTHAALTGADWDATGQLVVTAGGADIDIDGHSVMRGGRYLI